MKRILTICLLMAAFSVNANSSRSDEELCLAFVRQSTVSYETAHENENCLRAAESGVGSAQYAVGMGYGFSGNANLERDYYRLAANNRNIAAYLALGHALRDDNVWESIYWYQRFAATKTDGYGYAAFLLSKVFAELGDKAQSEYWWEVCKLSQYKACKGQLADNKSIMSFAALTRTLRLRFRAAYVDR